MNKSHGYIKLVTNILFSVRPSYNLGSCLISSLMSPLISQFRDSCEGKTQIRGKSFLKGQVTDPQLLILL